MFCSNCGVMVKDRSHVYCSACGVRLKFQEEASKFYRQYEDASDPAGEPHDEAHGKGFSDQVRHTFAHATEKINHMVGEEGKIDLDLKDVFSSVFKKHTKEEGEILFTSGTKLTTPEEKDIPESWPKPWLFSRVFLVLALAYVFLFISTYIFKNVNTLPGLIMIGSFAVPFSLLMFFWEMNAPRNISVYEMSRMFFIGGTASLVITLFLYSFFPVNHVSIFGSVVVGIIEELGKLVIVAYFIRRLNPKYILNGLLIGATIGAGFASFESAGYAFDYGLTFGNHAMLSTIFTRAWTAIGTHTVWAAISGGALVYVKGDNPLRRDYLINPKFIKLFIIPILLHALWDLPLALLPDARFIILIVIAWIFIFTFINAGLKQIMRLHQAATQSQQSVG